MTTLKGMGHPDMEDYRLELLWNGKAFQQVLVVDTLLEIRIDRPDYDEARLRALVRFVQGHQDTLSQIGFIEVPPMAFRKVDANDPGAKSR